MRCLSPRKIVNITRITAITINKASLFKNEIISVNVSKTKTNVFIATYCFELFSLEFAIIYMLFM